MKKFFLIFCLFMCFSFFCFAQQAKIIDINGEVSVKKELETTWKKAAVGMLLESNTEIKTSKKSSCTLVFDEERKNVMTIKENTEVKLSQLLPVDIKLDRGKVLALIKNIKTVKEFKIKTPVAVAGVRGTGESVEHNDDGTEVRCFEGVVNVVDLNMNSKDIEEGFGIKVGADGNLGDEFKLGREDFDEWKEFNENIPDTTDDTDKGAQAQQSQDQERQEEYREEQKEDYRQGTLEEERRQQDRQDNREGNGEQHYKVR